VGRVQPVAHQVVPTHRKQHPRGRENRGVRARNRGDNCRKDDRHHADRAQEHDRNVGNRNQRAAEFLIRDDAGRDDHDDHIEDRHPNDRQHHRQRDELPRFLDLAGDGRDDLKAEKRHEDGACCGDDPRWAGRREVNQVCRLDEKQANPGVDQHNKELGADHQVLGTA